MLDRIDVKYFRLAVGSDRIGRDSDLDISARCPVCGDSCTNSRKKRLHLYTKQGLDRSLVHCFNGDCSVQNKTMYSFLRDFFPSLLDQYKRENFSTTIQKLGSSEDVFERFKTNEQPKSPVQVHDLSTYLKDIIEVPQALSYIKNRGHEYNEKVFGKWYYGYQDLKIADVLYKISDSIVIPLYYNNEMYGFYSRNISSKVFYTYMPDINTGYKIWNWFNIDVNQPVYIFEGIFDAISSGLRNSIALMGAKIPDERLQELTYPVFVLDNDKTGKINAIEYAKKGHSVYVQPNDLPEKDMNELMLNHSDINIPDMIKQNIFSGIAAVVRIKSTM